MSKNRRWGLLLLLLVGSSSSSNKVVALRTVGTVVVVDFWLWYLHVL